MKLIQEVEKHFLVSVFLFLLLATSAVPTDGQNKDILTQRKRSEVHNGNFNGLELLMNRERRDSNTGQRGASQGSQGPVGNRGPLGPAGQQTDGERGAPGDSSQGGQSGQQGPRGEPGQSGQGGQGAMPGSGPRRG